MAYISILNLGPTLGPIQNLLNMAGSMKNQGPFLGESVQDSATLYFESS